LHLPIEIFVKNVDGKAIKWEEINIGYGFVDGQLKLMKDDSGELREGRIYECQIRVQRAFMYGLEICDDDDQEDELANKGFIGVNKPVKTVRQRRRLKCYRCKEKRHTAATCEKICEECDGKCLNKTQCISFKL